MGQRVGERRARDVHAQDVGGDARHQLGRQPHGLGIERGVADGLGRERVQLGCQMPVRAVGLQQRGRGLHGLEQLLVDRARARCAGAGRAAAAAAAGAGRAGAGPMATPRSENTAS